MSSASQQGRKQKGGGRSHSRAEQNTQACPSRGSGRGKVETAQVFKKDALDSAAHAHTERERDTLVGQAQRPDAKARIPCPFRFASQPACLPACSCVDDGSRARKESPKKNTRLFRASERVAVSSRKDLIALSRSRCRSCQCPKTLEGKTDAHAHRKKKTQSKAARAGGLEACFQQAVGPAGARRYDLAEFGYRRKPLVLID